MFICRRLRLLSFPLLLLLFRPRGISCRLLTQGNNNDERLRVSTVFPPIEDTMELGYLSNLVYSFQSQRVTNCSQAEIVGILFPNDLKCHFYERDSQDTQVVILSRASMNYVAVVFAGTDDLRNWLTDSDIRTKPFGYSVLDDDNNTIYPLSPVGMDVRVHAGFDGAVFHDGLFSRILDTVLRVKKLHPKYRILTTGHSLGAANSVLTTVALHLTLPHSKELIVNVNFGCPRTGNRDWRTFVNSMNNVGIWRLVHGYDLVPRMPDSLRFVHVGHTVQLDSRDARAYYLHDGDKSLGFAGVPWGWSSIPYVIAPGAMFAHFIDQYEKYLRDYSEKDPDRYYVKNFQLLNLTQTPEYHEDDDAIMPYHCSDEPMDNSDKKKTLQDFFELYRDMSRLKRHESGIAPDDSSSDVDEILQDFENIQRNAEIW